MGTVTDIQMEWRRNGSQLELRGNFTTGTVSGSNASIGLPNNLVIRAVSVSTGAGLISNNSTTNPANRIHTALIFNGDSAVFMSQTRTDAAISPLVPQTGTTILSSTMRYSILGILSMPIQGWEDTAMLSTTETLMRGDKFRASRNGTNQTGINTNGGSYAKILFNSVSATQDYTVLGYDTSNSRFVAKVRDKYAFTANVFINGANVGNDIYSLVFYVNGSLHSYGPTIHPKASTGFSLNISADIVLNPTDYVEVYFRGYPNNSSSTLTLDGTSTMSYFTGKQLFDPTVCSVYGPTTVQEQDSGGLVNYSITADQYGNLGSAVNLQPGEYEWEINASFFSNGATTSVNAIVGLGTTTGNSGAGMTYGKQMNATKINNTTTTFTYLSASQKKLVVSAASTYYIKAAVGSSITNLQIAWSFAIRSIKGS